MQAYAMEAFQPRALSLHGLSPGCRYAVYIGGTSPKGRCGSYGHHSPGLTYLAFANRLNVPICNI